MADTKPDQLATAQTLFDFLRGRVPDGYKLAEHRVPHLTPDQAWCVVWYVQELHMQLSDAIERCDVCGDLFDSNREGGYAEDGPPWHFCEACNDNR